MYLFKALLVGDVAGYDRKTKYSRTGWNRHPDPDRRSKEPCGRGYHLVKSLLEVPRYVNDAKWVFLAHYRGRLGEDTTKIRVAAVRLVLVAEWAKLATLYADYKQKRDTLDADYQQKRATLYADYQQKRDTLDADYQQKLDTLDADYQQKLATLYADYKQKRDTLVADHDQKQDTLVADHDQKQDTLVADHDQKQVTLVAGYQQKLLKKFLELAVPCQ